MKTLLAAGIFGAIAAAFVWLLKGARDTVSFDPAEPIDPFPDASTVLANNVCVNPAPRPGVEAFRAWVLATYGGSDGGIWRACNVGATSEHKVGRAWDWMTPAKPGNMNDKGDELISFLSAGDFAAARRFGIGIIIWDRRIWTAWRRAEGWRAYGGPNPHTDHVHFSFSEDGAMGRTSGYAWLASQRKEV